MNDSRTTATAALLLRLALGMLFIAHALLKYFVFTPARHRAVLRFARPARLPRLRRLSPSSWPAASCSLAGVRTRAVALALIPVLLGATWAHAGNGWLFTSANGGWEYPAFLTVAARRAGLLGDGALRFRPSCPRCRGQRA